MNIFFRVLLAAYAFCLAIISAICILITFRTEIFDSISSFLADVVLVDVSARILMFVIALIFFVLSLMFLLSGVKSNKDKRAVKKHTNIGEIKISLNSIENIALNTVKKLNGIRDTKTRVFKVNDTVSIAVNAIVMPEVNIPSVSEDIQEKVKASVEDYAGITVSDVKVIIDGIFSGPVYKARVE